MRRNRVIYTLLSIGAIGAFFGRGMGAVDRNDTVVGLFTGSFDHVFGLTVSTDTATNWVKGFGWFDLTVSAVIAVMLVGNVLVRGPLYRFAYSRFAYVVFGWGALWGLVTAVSRVTAAGDVRPAIWEFVERAPIYMLPAALVYLIYQHRLDHTHSRTTTEAINPATNSPQ
jgi:hypothetical protein